MHLQCFQLVKFYAFKRDLKDLLEGRTRSGNYRRLQWA